MKRHIAHCMAGSLWGLMLTLNASCDSSNKWNEVEFYAVEKQEQLKEEPKDRAADSVYAPLRNELPREMDVRVDMQFMKSDNVASEEACRLINAQLIELLLKQPGELSIDEAVAQYIEDVKTEFRNDEVASVYYDHVTGRAEYGFDNIINYRLTEETFMGGAHPSTVTTILRFNTATGEFITLDNVFPTSNQDVLKEKLLAKLMANNGVETLKGLYEKGFLEMADLFVSPNFALRADSIEFYYNEYDIAPYAYGPSTICLSYDDVKDIITAAMDGQNPPPTF